MKAYRARRRREVIENSRPAAVGVVLLAFGAAALLTSFYFLLGKGPREIAILAPAGGTVSDIAVAAPDTVLHVTVQQALLRDGWSYIAGKLIGPGHDVLLEFGHELWRESGVDRRGSWSASHLAYDLHVTVPEPGTYQLAFEAETGHMGTMSVVPAREIADAMKVVLQPREGSAVPFRTAGLLALLAGFIMHESATGALRRRLGRREASLPPPQDGVALAQSPWRTKTVLAALVASIVLYALLFVPSFRGYGHASPTEQPSFWSFESVEVHHDASVRAGSRAGPGVAGGGK